MEKTEVTRSSPPVNFFYALLLSSGEEGPGSWDTLIG